MEWSIRDWLDRSNVPEQRIKWYYLSKIMRLATTQFKYESETLDNLFLIEKYLFEDGRVMIWYSDILGWVITRCVETGFNINGIAIRWRPVLDKATDYETLIPTPEMGLDDKCVVIYDTPNRFILSRMCAVWIDDIADTNETIRTQIFNQKSPLLVISDNPKNTDYLKKAVVDIAKNVKALVIRSDIRQAIQPLAVDAPFNIEQLQAHIKQKESEMLEFLGIDSQSPYQKKAQLLASEQESNGQILTYLIDDRFRSRKLGIDRLNEKGLKISVEKVKVDNPNVSDMKDDGGKDDANAYTLV